MNVALLQMFVTDREEENLDCAEALVMEAAAKGADFAMLPEMFCCPYETACFAKFAQETGGQRWKRLSALARRAGLYLVAGSVPECDDGGRIYNTSYVFDRSGEQLARHRKAHLFDIDIPGGQVYRESDVLSPGHGPTVFQTEFGPMGLMICFDIRFAEMTVELTKDRVRAIFVPAAFNPTTGPLHWELLFRARAVDGQCYLLGTAPACNESASYHSYGHSIAVSPWGEVLTQLEQTAQTVVVTLDPALPDAVRSQIPLMQSRRW